MKSRTGMRVGEYFGMYIEIRKAGSYCFRKSYGGFSRLHCCLNQIYRHDSCDTILKRSAQSGRHRYCLVVGRNTFSL